MPLKLLVTTLWAAWCLSMPLAASQPVVPLPEELAPPALTTAEPDLEPGVTSRWTIVLVLILVALALMMAIALLMISLALTVRLLQYREQQRWRRVKFVHDQVRAFEQQVGVSKILGILDFEEYRDLRLNLPHSDSAVVFEATDQRLRCALRSHDQMVGLKQGLQQLIETPDAHDLNGLDLDPIKQYAQTEFPLQVALRDWFDQFLRGLEHFDELIESKLSSVEELRPYILYWLQLIGDRKYRRKEGSSFYEQLFNYIHDAGYTGVETLFKRYGYQILPPPYQPSDFCDFDDPRTSNLDRCFSLAKAAYLVYEDQRYLQDIVGQWIGDGCADKQVSGENLVSDAIREWRQPRAPETANPDHFAYFDSKAMGETADTQAFAFKRGSLIVLVFRGTQQIEDWLTNANIRLQSFPEPNTWGKGQVHAGFQTAWKSVQAPVVAQLQAWQTQDTQLWITGHSLGGALATLAAASLQEQGIAVKGLCTFGQPRTGNREFAFYFRHQLKIPTFRFVNNYDVVPQIPPQPPYQHLDQLMYFDSKGKLHSNSTALQRFPDRLLGYLRSTYESGFDAICDHRMEFYIAGLSKAQQQGG